MSSCRVSVEFYLNIFLGIPWETSWETLKVAVSVQYDNRHAAQSRHLLKLQHDQHFIHTHHNDPTYTHARNDY